MLERLLINFHFSKHYFFQCTYLKFIYFFRYLLYVMIKVSACRHSWLFFTYLFLGDFHYDST
jgi:hypothetical protein